MPESPLEPNSLKQTALLLEKLLFPTLPIPAQIQQGLEKYGTRGFFQRLEELDFPPDTLTQLQAVRLVLYGKEELTPTEDQKTLDVDQSDKEPPHDSYL